MEALTGYDIMKMASSGECEYEVEKINRSSIDYRVFTGRREAGEVIRVSKISAKEHGMREA